MLDAGRVVNTSESRRDKTQFLVKFVIAICGAFSLTFGIWAEFWPRSFAALILFPPYNEHLVHDVGAFQIGIGVTALLALLPIDAPTVFLGGFLAGASFHAANHMVDRHLGGHSADVLGLGLLAVLAALALALHVRRQATLRQPNPSDSRSEQ
jgi:hypothetical protein